MRNEALRTLEQLAERDERVVFITGDLGYMVVEPFFRRFPERAFNVGVAEQNMLALATGIAEAGLLPFVYSIAPFSSLRPFEFIRNGPVLQNLPVRIIGVGGGMDYGINGPTHYAIDDVGVLRTQPGLTIVTPADRRQTRAAIEATWTIPGPVYYRLSKGGVESLPGLDGRWDDTGVQTLSEGDGSVALVAMGGAARELEPAADALAGRGVIVSTAVVSRVSPAPTDAVAELVQRHELVVTIESHYVTGGLGSLVCEVAAETPSAALVRRCAVRVPPVDQVGSAAHMARTTGTDHVALTETVLSELLDLRAGVRER